MSSSELAVVQDIRIGFGTPRKLPRPASLPGEVVVLDIAFAAKGGGKGFAKLTEPFIDALGERLLAWVDHHDSQHHRRFRADPRFVLATKAEHGACPEMITPELVARFARPETIVCHTDFDGLVSAAKWICAGREPYPGADDDARAVDTCLGRPGPVGTRIERSLRARPRDLGLRAHVVEHLVQGAAMPGAWAPIDEAAADLVPLEERAHELARGYRALGPELVIVDATAARAPYDKTLLLLLGQQRAAMSAVIDGDTVTFAAPFDSGIDFLERFGLSGGMPTRVSIRRADLARALSALGIDEASAARLI